VPVLQTSLFAGKLKEYLWTHTKSILPCPNDETKRIFLLDAKYDDVDLSFLPENTRDLLKKSEFAVEVVEKEYGYDQMSTSEVLSQVIPLDVEKVMAFETAGHIAHMNLRDETEKYKYVIGQVILDKNKNLKTIVNKTSEISTVYRTFNMELIAGEENMMTETKECGCRYKFDFSKVYWNSRLGMEHERLVNLFQKGQVIVDMFCGIGPFALPASKKGCIVYANDLNPSSYEYLNQNATLNKCKINSFCLDGGEFARLMFNGNEDQKKLNCIDHVVMNLPASAVSFLSCFIGINNNNKDAPLLPMIHCYGFAFGDKPDEEIIKQAEEVLGKKLVNPTAFNVRSVSTNKHMMRLSFQLTVEISVTNTEIEMSELNDKKRKFDETLH
jgi:tRNA (guanine37-N1)-methyltransferase